MPAIRVDVSKMVARLDDVQRRKSRLPLKMR